VKLVYCSGPLFCPEEIAGMTAIARVLEGAGYGTFLPHRDGVERLVMGLVNSPVNVDILGSRDRVDRAIFALDVFQIVERCDCLVFNMNGRVPDEGGAAEAGIAFAAGKPVVLYKSDRRSSLKGRDNSMLRGLSGMAPVTDIGKLPAAVRKALAAAAAGGRAVPAFSESLREALRRGEKVWKIVGSLGRGGGKPEEAELVRMIMDQAGEA